MISVGLEISKNTEIILVTPRLRSATISATATEPRNHSVIFN